MDRNLDVGSNEIDQKHLEDRRSRIQMLRKAYQEGTLKVNSGRLAEKLLKFEQAVERTLPKQ